MLSCAHPGCEGQMTPMRISPGFERVQVTASVAEAATGKQRGPLNWTVLRAQTAMMCYQVLMRVKCRVSL